MAVATRRKEASKETAPERPRGSRYRLLASIHEYGFGKEAKIIKKGGIVYSETDLRLLFPNKFEKLRDDVVLDEEEQAEAAEQTPPGVDVTEMFPEAEDAGMMVYKDKKNYTVIDKGMPSKPLNTDPLTTRQQVSVFVKDYLAS